MATNKNSIIRLSRYKNSLYRLKALGFIKVFSDNLADSVGVTSSQVRKDFSMFNITGNKRGGYDINKLIEKMNRILGKDKLHKAIIVGQGKIGTALKEYSGFKTEGIEISATFDIDPSKYDKSKDIPVLSLEELKDFVKQNKIKIGIIAVPEIAAQYVADIMISSGIKGILNFAPIQIKGVEDCIINNVNLVLELENVIYFVDAM
jgi:redox-sensing transcriptional repressor